MFKYAKKLLALALSGTIAFGIGSVFTGCTKDEGKETIVFGLSKTWETYKPTEYMNVATHQVGNQIFDKLVYISEDYTVSPRGAKSWEWSADGKTLTFHLDEKATWHDGEKVTAEDYVFSIKFYATSEASFMNRAFTKYLEGVDYQTGVETSPDSASAEAVDEYTFKLNFSGVYNQNSFMKSSLNMFYVLPKHCFENGDGTLKSDEEIYNDSAFWNAPIGSGPFKYKSEVTDTSVTLTANENYQLGAPEFDTLIMQVVDTSTAVDKILSGDLDILGFNLSSEVAEQYLDNDDVNIVKETNPSTELNLCFNSKRVPQKIRQAIDRGLDKQDILNKSYGGNGVINYSIVFPTYPGYVEKNIYNKQEAKDLVQSAISAGEWSADTVLKIAVVNTQMENVATLIKAQLQDLGIKAEVKTGEMTTIQDSMKNDKGTGDSYEYSCALWSLGATYLPSKMLTTFALYGPYLFLNNDGTALYPTYQKYMTAATPEEEKSVIGEFQAWEYEYVPQSTIVQYGAYSATATGISNVDLFNTTNFNQASWLWKVK